MKILILHNEYLYRGGEDSVVQSEHDLLAPQHDVRLFRVKNHGGKAGGILDMMGGFIKDGVVTRDLKRVIDEFMPDIAHAHNIFYSLGSRGIDSIRASGIPLVMTLHNYRPICPAATFYRQGKTCELCINKTLMWPAAVHGCFKGSRAMSAALAGTLSYLRTTNYWNRRVDRFICLTEFQKLKFTESGIDGSKIFVKPNFVHRQADPKSASRADDALFVGRISAEKGVACLVRANWHVPQVKVSYAGDGPEVKSMLEDEKFKAGYLGILGHEELLNRLRRIRFLIFPSMWYEGMPMTILEAFSAGKPVIASRLGAMRELIDDGKTGLLFEPGNPKDLSEKMRYLWENPEIAEEMGRNALKAYQDKYSPEKNYELLMEIYRQAIEVRGRKRVRR